MTGTCGAGSHVTEQALIGEPAQIADASAWPVSRAVIRHSLVEGARERLLQTGTRELFLGQAADEAAGGL